MSEISFWPSIQTKKNAVLSDVGLGRLSSRAFDQMLDRYGMELVEKQPTAPLISEPMKAELDTILRSFLERKGDGTPPTIAQYDIPHIVAVIGQRITREIARGSTLVPQQQTSGSEIPNNCPQNTTQEKT